jgi:hypothetical protein
MCRDQDLPPFVQFPSTEQVSRACITLWKLPVDRTVGCTVNLKVSSFIPDDVFQGHIQMSPTDSDMEEEDGLKFDKFLPFTDFRLTAYGRT